MKIIKRNGAEENFDPMKIRNAVLGANGNVERESDRLYINSCDPWPKSGNAVR